jgi:hypothetical protein
MRKLNLDQLEGQLEVIHSNELYCIKGGYGTTGSGGYGNGYYDPFADIYDSNGGGNGIWGVIVEEAAAGSLAPGTYTNLGDDLYSYTAPGDTNYSDPGMYANVGGYSLTPQNITGSAGGIGGTVATNIIGGPGALADSVFDCMAYASSQLGGNASETPIAYQNAYDAIFNPPGDGVRSSDIVAFANDLNLVTFNVSLANLPVNSPIPSTEVIMTDVSQGLGTSHEEILAGIYYDANPTNPGQTQYTAMLLDPENGNAVTIVNLNQIDYSNLIGFNAAH